MAERHNEETRLFELVKLLTELPGPIGDEQAVSETLSELWNGKAERIWQTPVGNVFAHVGGKGPKLLIGGHSDEICFLIKSISDDGFLHLSIWNADRIGRLPNWLFPVGQVARVVGPATPVYGVLATSTGHAANRAHLDKPHLDWNDIFVDIGAASRADVLRRGIRVGHRVIWYPPTRRLSGSLIVGKAMDNRVALAIMTALLDEIDPAKLAYDVYFVSTVLEETGLLGASSTANEMKFDLAIALDVGLAGDIPTGDLLDVPVRLGGGPAIVHQDSATHYTRWLSERLIEVAATNDISLQHAVFQQYASDGAAFIRSGIPTALVAFPARYTHSPFEVVDEHDLKQIVRLLNTFVESQS